MLQEINVETEKLQEILKTNLVDHVELYNFAYEEWQKKYTLYVAEFAKKVKNGDYKAKFNPPQAPISYAKNYEDVLMQLSLTYDDVISLDEHSFKNYVLDEWNFTSSFYSTVKTFYSPMSSGSSFSKTNLEKLSRY